MTIIEFVMYAAWFMFCFSLGMIGAAISGVYDEKTRTKNK